MAAGLGLLVDTVKAIKDGAAPDQEHDLCKTWLGRIEDLPVDVRARQFLAAGKGGRFDIEVQGQVDPPPHARRATNSSAICYSRNTGGR